MSFAFSVPIILTPTPSGNELNTSTNFTDLIILKKILCSDLRLNLMLVV